MGQLGVAAAKSITPALILFGSMIAVVLVAGVFLLLVRARTLNKDAAGKVPEGIFDELRGMRNRGEISAAEFERARGVMVARLRGPSARDSSGPRKPDRGVGMPGANRERVAPPGVDLTGRPLPPSVKKDEDGAR